MIYMTKTDLAQILSNHAAWRKGEAKGKHANLSRADLTRADLSGANLSRANLSGANLTMAYLGGADLTMAYLGGANLSRADLSGADLTRADLSGADLSGANLSRANLSRADLSGANRVIALGQPNGWWAFAYLWEGTIWVRVGCRTFPLAEGRIYWTGKENRREVIAVLDYAEIVARLRGWEFT